MPFRRSPRAWIVLALCVSGCAPAVREAPLPGEALPPIEVSIDERFYLVEGVTPVELNRALRENGPRDDDAERSWYGATDFALRYRFEPLPWANGCRAAAARVEVDLVTTLPEWPERETAPAMLREDWDLFLGRLREHERGHQRIAIELGQNLLRSVEALRSPDCDALKTEAARLAEAFRSAGDVEHASWDLQTAHGLVSAGDVE